MTLKDSTELDSQGLKNKEITKANYALTVIFIAIDPNGTDFHFLNKFGRQDFSREWRWREKWKKFIPTMKPMSIHAFLMKSWPTKGGYTGQDFYPVAHIGEFDTFREARLMNSKYREIEALNIQNATAYETKLYSCAFARKLKEWIDIRDGVHAYLAEEASRIFDGEVSKEMMASALAASEHKIDLQEIVNNTEGNEFYQQLLNFSEEHAFLNEQGNIEWLHDFIGVERVTPENRIGE
jgi:hypothetical protein